MKFIFRHMPVQLRILTVFFCLAAPCIHSLYAQDETAPTTDGVTKTPPTEEKPDPLKRR